MASKFQALPGFRDFAPRDRDMNRYLFEAWTAVARRYGFSEYEAPILEAAELYLKKSGGELSTQLFRFEDQGTLPVAEGKDGNLLSIQMLLDQPARLARQAQADQDSAALARRWNLGFCEQVRLPRAAC